MKKENNPVGDRVRRIYPLNCHITNGCRGILRRGISLEFSSQVLVVLSPFIDVWRTYLEPTFQPEIRDQDFELPTYCAHLALPVRQGQISQRNLHFGFQD